MTDLDAFRAEVESWLDANYPRSDANAPRRVADSEQSDDVSLFEDLDDDIDEVGDARAWREQLAAAGFAWITGPPEFGGRGLSMAHQRVFDETARRYNVPSNRLLMVSLGMIVPTILRHGSETAKARYLEPLMSGKLIACQLFSEPGAGSDLGAVSSRAIRDGDGWRVSGQKVWTSGAHFSDIGLCLCRTSDGERRRNLTMFVIDMRAPGVEVRPLRQMTGGAAFNEVFLDDVRVPDSDRVGDVDDGWSVMITTLQNERASIGGTGFGGVGLLSVERYVEMVRRHGRSDDPVVRQDLARLVCELRVAKYNGLRAAANRRVGRATPEGSFGKLALSRNYQRISDLVSRLLGPSLVADTGDSGTNAWSSFVLGVPGMRIGGGTDEVLMNAVAERQLGLPKDPPGV